MAGKKATSVNGRGASAAAASPAETRVSDAELAGRTDDQELESELLNQLGGEPATARGDAAAARGATRQQRAAGDVQPEGGTDETPEGEDPNQDPNADPDADPNADPNPDPNAEPAAGDPNAEPAAGAENDPNAATDPNAEPSAPAAAAANKDDDLPPGVKRVLAELREDRRQLLAQIAELKSGRSTGGNATPQTLEGKILAADTPEDLTALREHWENMEDLAAANPNGYQAPGKDGEPGREFTAEEMGQLRTNARRAQRLIGQREQQLQKTQQYVAAAHTLYPAFNDPTSEETRSLQWILQQVPELKRLPMYKTIIGDALAGERMRIKAAQATAAAKNGKNGQPLPGKPAAAAITRRPPPAVPGAPHRAPSAPPPKAAKIAAARERAVKSGGSEAAIADLVEAAL